MTDETDPTDGPRRSRPRPESGGPRGYDAAKKVKGRKRHVVTDTSGLLVGVVVHPADIQDRDGAGTVIKAIHDLFPWLRHLFADSVYNGPNLCEALAKFGHWAIEIVTRAAGVAGFQLLPRRWVVERNLACLNRNRRLAKDFETASRSSRRCRTSCARSCTIGCRWPKSRTLPAWLGEEPTDAARLKALLAPYPSEEMVAWPVSPRVGNVKKQ